MRIFNLLKGKQYEEKIKPYEECLTGYFAKLGNAYNIYTEALDNEEYKLYIHYNKWPIRKLEYSYVISEVKKTIFNGAKVLDAGCGVSSMPFLWADLGGDVTAVDFDKKSIDLMKKFDADSFFSNNKINLKTCDIMKLPFEDETFDIVVTTSVIEHLPYPNYLLALSELYRVVKKNGHLVCTCDLNDRKDSKRRSVGAFSVGDIKQILEGFSNEVESDGLDYHDLSITSKEIEEFWLNHYYDGIGYEGNREYVAVGFCINKVNNENIKQKLLKYNNLIEELIAYENEVQKLIEDRNQIINYTKDKDEECKRLVQNVNILTEESCSRLDIINKLSKESDNQLSNICKLTEESQERLDQILKLTEEKKQLNTDNQRLMEESQERLDQILKLTEEKKQLFTDNQKLMEESQQRLDVINKLTLKSNK